MATANNDVVGGPPMALASTPAARAFLARISEIVRQALSHRRPWSEIVDRSAFAKPESLSEATGRIRKNWGYFRVNYCILLTVVLAFSLVSNPASLLLLCVLLGGWIYVYLFRTSPMVLFNRTLSEREVLALMGVLTVLVVFLTSVAAVLISAAVVGLAIICAHAAFRVPDDLFLDEEGSAGGLLSILGVTPAQLPVTNQV